MSISQRSIKVSIATSLDEVGPNTSGKYLYKPLDSQEAIHEWQFIWNSRKCVGNRFHQAAFEGDLETMRILLETEEDKVSAVRARFTYETVFGGKVQEGSGEAIHLAVSRGHIEVTDYLLLMNADVMARVTRSHLPHYDVLHAAVFAEGRGGFEDIVEFLLEAEADILSRNLEGRSALHLAFQAGSVPLVKLFRRRLSALGIDDTHFQAENVPLPLALGISQGIMAEEELVESAELTSTSLRTFIHDCPQCIPSFLDRLKRSGKVTAVELAKNLTPLDIAQALRDSPAAASALMEHACERPDCDNVGWNPIPTRVNFVKESFTQSLKDLINPREHHLTLYEATDKWTFDADKFTAPDWQKAWLDKSSGSQLLDADIVVCHIPNLICLEVFAGLCCPYNSEVLSIYENDVIQSAIKHLFWNGCASADQTQVLLTLWTLGLLLLETGLSFELNCSTDIKCLKDERVAISFLAAKGLVDLILEICTFAGLASIGLWNEYLCLQKVFSLLVAILPVYLIFEPGNKLVMVIIILLYWGRMLQCFTSAEFISRELIPISNMANGVKPALLLLFVNFCAFSHAFYSLGGREKAFWPDVFFQSFSTLVTAALPEKPDVSSKDKTLELLLVYAAVLIFTVYILNLFIGIMAEQYIVEKDRCHLVLRQLRAQTCFSYLAKSRILPCNLCSRGSAMIVFALAVACALAIQVYSFLRHGYQSWVGVTFFVCQFSMVLAAFQDSQAPWIVHSPVTCEAVHRHYLWICKARCEEDIDPALVEARRLLQMVEELPDDDVLPPIVHVVSSRRLSNATLVSTQHEKSVGSLEGMAVLQ